MKFHYLVRGITRANGKVLLARQKGALNTFLPGGHIRIGEKAEIALAREIEEETGNKVIVKRFIGAVECSWKENNLHNHEINLVFEFAMPDLDSTNPPHSNESHLEFIWVELAELKKHNLQPCPLLECIMGWKENYNGFWGSAMNSMN